MSGKKGMVLYDKAIKERAVKMFLEEGLITVRSQRDWRFGNRLGSRNGCRYTDGKDLQLLRK